MPDAEGWEQITEWVNSIGLPWPALIITASIFQSVALLRQSADIRTGRNLSAIWHGYYTCMFASLAIYAGRRHGVDYIAMMVNGILLCCGHGAIFWCLAKQKTLSTWEKAMLPLALLLPIGMWLLQGRYHFFFGTMRAREMVLLADGVIAVTMLMIQIYESRERGEQRPGPILGYLALAICWFGYSSEIEERVLQVTNLTFGVLFLWWLVRWWWGGKAAPVSQPAKRRVCSD